MYLKLCNSFSAISDVTALTSACKGWLYQDMFEKPSELVLYRRREEGGLGLHNIRCKSLASLICTFLQTAANPRYQLSLYHSLLYRRYCLDDESVVNISHPPYYSKTFFKIIEDVLTKPPMNPIHMSIKQ